MNRKIRGMCAAVGLFLLALGFSGCGETSKERVAPETPRTLWNTVLVPEAPGEVVQKTQYVNLDASRTSEGYFQISYTGAAAKAKVQLVNPDGTKYTYTLLPGDLETLPLTGGDGTYEITVLENAFDNMYAMVFSGTIQADSVAEFMPYLYPNQYVWFTPDCPVYGLGVELSAMAADDLDYVDVVYEYVVQNIDYDNAKASSPPVEYLSDISKTIENKIGICVDYAALMTALLRTQGIPTKVVVGYSGQTYHAWISVYLEQTGWVDGAIYFDGTSWSRMDPTLAAGNRDTSVKDYVNDSSNYTEKYFY